jgi:predicted phosphodiesterase
MRRLSRIRDTIIRYKDLRASAYPTNKITVAVIGDMLSGTIHEELEVTNEHPISEALVTMAYALFDLGKALADGFPVVEMVIVPGNHPRMEKKPRSKNKWNNYEWIMGKFVQGLATAAGNIFAVVVPKDLVYVHTIFDKKVGITHGDGVKAASFAGIPHYAMKTRQDAIQALLKDLKQPQLDLLVYGHFHRLIYDEGQGCSLVINGSIKGGDEHGIATRYSAPRPVQALLTFHPKYGLTDLSRINLDSA